MIKSLDFQGATKESLNDWIHILINDRNIADKINRNDDSYYLNSELIDLEAVNSPNSSQGHINSCNFHIKFYWVCTRIEGKWNYPCTKD